MDTFEGPTTLVGVSELRSRLDEILKLAKQYTVYLGKRNQPVAVLLPIEQYREMEALLDYVEESILVEIAREREASAEPSDYLSLTELEAKIAD